MKAKQTIYVLIVVSLLYPMGSRTACAQSLPANLGSGLRQLVESHLAGNPGKILAGASRIQTDEGGRVAVNLHLDGKVNLGLLRTRCEKLGLGIIAVNEHYRAGVISAWLPLERAASIAREKGVSSVVAVPLPYNNVGATTAQSAFVHRTDDVNTPGILTPEGFQGEGITIGVLSDSYDRASGSNAIDGVNSGDLPGVGNPVNPTPVVVVSEAPNLGPANGLLYTDEGRGMLEILHDLAPKAKLAFATAYSTDVAFANNIIALRTNPAALCDLIVDDIIYLNEPMFSDGIVAQAVDTVVTSNTLAGKNVAYFSSAGNNGNDGYESPFRFVSLADAVALTNQNLNPAGVPSELYAGGLHDFDPGAGIDISQTVICRGGSATLVFQWDDPFDVPGGGVTTDYNLLVFDEAGNYLAALSGVDDNFATNQPLEVPSTDLSGDVTYQLVIGRRSGGSKLAGRLRYVAFAGGSFSGEYLRPDEPTIYGHAGAAHAAAVAAYVYDDNPGVAGLSPSLEEFSSFGPVTIAFDANGTRLGTPVVRQKPDLAGADGVNTTFFPPGPLSSTDYEGDGFPNFFGTSASAPAATGVAGLVLQAAGGPGSLTASELVQTLKDTAPPRDMDPQFSEAVLAQNGIEASVTGNGSDPFDPNFFKITFLAPAGVSLTSLNIDLQPAGLEFDPDPVSGFPLTGGDETEGVTLMGLMVSLTNQTASGGFQILNAAVPAGNFTSGGLAAFGIDRDIANNGTGGNSADLLEGGVVTLQFSDGAIIQAPFVNSIGTVNTTVDGAGLIDALDAASAAIGNP